MVEGGVEPGGGVPEPGVSPWVQTGSREGGEGAGELHGIEEGVGGCGGLLVRHLRGSDDHHHSVLSLESLCSAGDCLPGCVLATGTCSVHQHRKSTPTLSRCFVQKSLDNSALYASTLLVYQYWSLDVSLTCDGCRAQCNDPRCSARDVSQCLNPTFHWALSARRDPGRATRRPERAGCDQERLNYHRAGTGPGSPRRCWPLPPPAAANTQMMRIQNARTKS